MSQFSQMSIPDTSCPQEASIDPLPCIDWLDSSTTTPQTHAISQLQTMEDVRRALAVQPELTKETQGELASALRTLGRLLDRPLHKIPVDPPSLSALLETVHPATHGLSGIRWRNVKSLVLRSLRETGICVRPSRARRTKMPEWKALWNRLPNRTFKFGLSRFINFCSDATIAPSAVSPATFTAFDHALSHQSLLAKPAPVVRQTGRLWNQAATTIPGWPAVTAPTHRNTRCYAPPITVYSDTFQTDLNAYIGHVGNPDPLADDYAPPLRVSTQQQRRKQILRMAAAKQGMADRNRARLRQFDNPHTTHALLCLPRKLMHDVAAHDDGTRAPALRALCAMAVELSIVAPMRINNLTGLIIGQHLVRSHTGRRPTMHLLIPADEMKNNQPFELALPAETTALLALYLESYHTRLSPTPTTLLFPNEVGGRRSNIAFSSTLTKPIRRETGIVMHMHLFRHLAITLHLAECPDDIEIARRLLGHRNSSTTQLQQLGNAMRAMAPGGIWSWIQRGSDRLRAQAKSVRDKQAALRSPAELAELGLALMAGVNAAKDTFPADRATAFRDGLMIALLATRALRMNALSAIDCDQHLARRGETWWLTGLPTKVKGRPPQEISVPAELTAPLERYLKTYRPVLLAKGRAKDVPVTGLWVSRHGTKMGSAAIQHQIRDRTETAFGTALPPHWFRDCAATEIAISAPAEVGIIKGVLDHATIATSERHYNQAGTHEAGRRYGDSLLKRRGQHSA